MTKATKNNGTFEAINTREGLGYIATRNNYEIITTPCDDYYRATLWVYDRPMVSVEGYNANWSISQLAKTAQAIAWTEENASDDVFALAKDLYDFIKRPTREIYNSRRLAH